MSGEASAPDRHDDIAIVGMACLFPGAPDVRAYWENIVGKVSAIGDPPPGWDHGGFFDPDSDEAKAFYCRRGGFLRDLVTFDPVAYGVVPQSVDGAEPEHFLALRIAYAALADAGYLDRPFNRDKTGVILGRGTFVNRGNVAALQHKLVIDQTLRLLHELHPEYPREELLAIRRELKASLPPFTAETAPGLVPNVMCGRIANRLDLKGPNFAVDAACASSLIAVNLAAGELRSGRCDVVLAGGVSLGAPPVMLMGFCELGALSRSQSIRPFDAEADGTVLGEGIGMVVLKRLTDARRDGDRIYAVIKGIGVSSDGRALAVLAPRREGQELALRRAYEESGISPRSIELIEAHGTATSVGDVTEIQALRSVFGDREGAFPRCAVGTVKSMISHTIPAAGVAGLIKTALALYHRTLPPTLNCTTPNPNLELDKTPFYINTETRPWIHGGGEPRRAGVSAFGFGGINAHVILEEPPELDESATGSCLGTWDSEVVIVQGATRSALIARGLELEQYLERSPDARLRDVAFTLNTPLEESGLKLSIVATSTAELRQKLAYALKALGEPNRRQIKDVSGIYFFEEPLGREGRLAFMFPGEGPQYPNMLADLCLEFPEVRRAFDEADSVFLDNRREYAPGQIVFPPPLETQRAEGALWQIDVAVGSVFAANQGLTALLGALGLEPSAVVGHSSGEYAALLAAGAVDATGDRLFRHALELNRLHASFEDRIPPAVLVAVGAIRPDSVPEVLAECAETLFMTMDNCPHQVVLCGTADSIEGALERLRRRGAICTVLPFKRGYHTAMFTPISGELDRFYEGISFRSPRVTVYSCATARPFPAEPAEIRRLVVAQWSSPVRFRETIETMYADGVRLFVEVGPGGNLCGFVDDILRRRAALSVPINVPHRSGLTQLNHGIGLLAAQGVPMRLDHLYARRAPRRLDLTRPEPEAAKRRSLMHLAVDLPTLKLNSPVPVPSHRPRPAPTATSSAPRSEPMAPGALNRAVSGPQTESTAAAHEVTSTSTHSGRDVVPTVAGASGNGAPAEVMLEYFRTMDRFLVVQQDVLQALLRATPSHTGTRPAPSGEPSTTTPAMANVPAVPKAVEVSPNRPAREMAVLVGSQGVASATPAPRPPEPSPEARGHDLASRLLAIVSEKTGYPVDMLDPTLNMEADLGIDSIKRVEILGAFQRETGLIGPDDMEQASNLKTLRQVIDYINGKAHRVSDALSSGNSNGDSPQPSDSVGIAAARGSDTSRRPFVHDIVSLTPGKEAVVSCTLDVRTHPFMEDHVALGRRSSPDDPSLPALPVVPLSLSLEMMAEAASLLVPEHHVIGMTDVRVVGWFGLEEGACSVVISAKRRSSEIPAAVEVRIVESGVGPGESEPRRPLVEGTVIIADEYPAPPPLASLALGDERPFAYARAAYYTDVMFHGPRFQGVAEILRCGDRGIEGRILTGVDTGWCEERTSRNHLIDPVLLDAAGQLVGFWGAERLERGFAFPTGFAALTFFGEPWSAVAPLDGRVRIRNRDEGRLRADIECIDGSGQLLARIEGWEDLWFDFPREFTRFNLSRRDGMLAEPWPAVVDRLAPPVPLTCVRLRHERLPAALVDLSKPFWLRVFARFILSRGEYDRWRTRGMPGRRGAEWLLGRLVAKDAVRLHLAARYGLRLPPAAIEIAADEHGAPVANGGWADALGSVPVVALAHTADTTVAVAGILASGAGLGIDLEQVRDLPEDLMAAAFTGEERTLLSALPREWGARLWCAKEAVGKALRRGLPGGPREVRARMLDPGTGRAELTVTGCLAREAGVEDGWAVTVSTFREDELAVAVAYLQPART